MAEQYPFLKGHGTRNDFVILPDLDGTLHGQLDDDRVRALCDRRSGIGADGVLRVVRGGVVAGTDPAVPWFMDYRNADGSVAEMCGNGIRVFGRYLVAAGLARADEPLPVDTRDGVKVLTFTPSGEVTVDMGEPRIAEETTVSVGESVWSALHVDMGNPHAVAFVDDLAEAGALLESPVFDLAVYPRGVNVEFVVPRGERHVAMRVHERGSGETQSCGTGACAVMVAAALREQPDGGARDVDYRVDLPGGTLTIRWTAGNRIQMTGPAEIVASGATGL
ncbi:diaminopimelate epimerase [Nocardioides sp. R-C-SC26]|uniref:diaminopimelate epimerase n=1 Tax=Nocardioides sp. R-C-SC26 TaxID=2870414 RepID=UPI001E3B48EB|nr:diaminopimelate epimerase [Nocardioides sp. R-C-SC26]